GQHRQGRHRRRDAIPDTEAACSRRGVDNAGFLDGAEAVAGMALARDARYGRTASFACLKAHGVERERVAEAPRKTANVDAERLHHRRFSLRTAAAANRFSVS